MKKQLLLLSLALTPLAAAHAGTARTTPGAPSDTTKQTTLRKVVNTIKDHVTFNGYAQGEYEYDSQGHPKDQFKISRVILWATAQVTKQLSARVMFDFKSATLHEAWANYKFCPELQIKAGQQKTPFSLENPISTAEIEHISPTMSLITNYMIGGGSQLTMPSCSGRDIGVVVYGRLLKGLLDYDLALMNGQGRNKNDANSQKDFVARLRVNPTSWLILSGSTILGTGNLDDVKPSADGLHYVSEKAPIDGLHKNGNFRRNRYAGGLWVKTRPFTLRSEYMAGVEGKEHSKGFYALAMANKVVKGLDIIGQFDWMDVWSGRTQRYTGGVQYWFYPKCRIQVLYAFQKSSTQRNQNLLQTQLQLAF